MGFKELLQIIVKDCDVSYAILIFAAMAVGILVWLITTWVYRGEISGLRVTIRDQEATIQGQQANITTLDEPIKLSKDLLWAVEFARVALERTVDELTQKVRRFITDDPPSKETIRQAIFATRIASAHLKNAGMKCLEAFLAEPGSDS